MSLQLRKLPKKLNDQKKLQQTVFVSPPQKKQQPTQQSFKKQQHQQQPTTSERFINQFKSLDVLSLTGEKIVSTILGYSPQVIPFLQVGNVDDLPNTFHDHKSYKELLVPHSVQEFIAGLAKGIDGAEDFEDCTLHGESNDIHEFLINKNLSDDIRKNDLILFKSLNVSLIGICHGTHMYNLNSNKRVLTCKFSDSDYNLMTLIRMLQNQELKRQISFSVVSKCDPFFRELSAIDDFGKSQLFPLICQPKLQFYLEPASLLNSNGKFTTTTTSTTHVTGTNIDSSLFKPKIGHVIDLGIDLSY